MKKYSVANALYPYVSYDMIHAHTELPAYSEPRSQLLHAVLAHSQGTKDRSELFTLVTALIQLGQDTHDLIDTETDKRTEVQMRSRQLKVLSGDFFSARFYQLLAAAGEIELVGILSKAVADVNRLKISFYEKVQAATLSAEDYLSNRIQLKSELFLPFHRLLDEPVASVWKELLYHASSFEVIQEELLNSFKAGGYARSYAYWSLIHMILSSEDKLSLEQSKYEALLKKHNLLEVMLDLLHTAFKAFIRLLDSEHLSGLKQELSYMIDNMRNQLSHFSIKEVEAK